MVEKSLVEEVLEILKSNPRIKFSSKQLAEQIIKQNPSKYQNKKVTAKRYESLTQEEKVLTQVRAEITARKKTLSKNADIEIILNNAGVVEFSYVPRLIGVAVENEDVKQEQEKDMYQPFIECLKNDFDYTIFAKRIDEKKTRKKEKGAFKWLHPDIVGIQRIGEDLCEETMDISRMFPNGGTNKETIKFWSFELKKKVTLSNIREIFFQTLSNSSWANFTYLVYEEIDEQAEEELKFLCNSYGVGAISFKEDINTDINYRIVQVAKESLTINWAFVDKLISSDKGSNSDFKDFMVLVKNFIKTGYLDNTKTWTDWKNQ